MTHSTPTRVGLLGAGTIARHSVDGIRRFPRLEVVGCVDVIAEAATALAAETDIPPYAPVDEMLADPEIDILVDITPPVRDAGTTIAALEAGKHVDVEKPTTQHVLEVLSAIQGSQGSGARVDLTTSVTVPSAPSTIGVDRA